LVAFGETSISACNDSIPRKQLLPWATPPESQHRFLRRETLTDETNTLIILPIFLALLFLQLIPHHLQTFPKNLSLLCKHKCMKCKPACLVWQPTRQSRGVTRKNSKTLQIRLFAAEITLHLRVLLHKSNRWTHLTIPSGASITTVAKQTPANAKILAATQRTPNQMSSKFCLHTQNKSLSIRSRTRTIRTGVTTTTSSEIAHETAKCLVRTFPTLTTPCSFRNLLRIV